MTKIPNGQVFHFDIDLLSRGMNITPDEVVQYFTDGRRVSFILERRIAREIMEGTIAQSEGASWDVLDSDGEKWEVRSLSRQGVYFCPSYMVGSGRAFEEAGFLRKLDEIRGYVISDIESFPNVPVWILEASDVKAWWESGELGVNSKISRVRALRLFEEWAS
jgi:hypothetical protein